MAAPASAKSYTLPAADVDLELQPDGSLLVTERITFAFSGPFSGAYRDIPLRRGEAITEVTVLENGVAYHPGASTVLGSSGDPGTYGVEDRGSVVRVVWHYAAVDEERIFTIRYRMTGVAVVYDDVVDVDFQVWGREWSTGVDRVDARLRFPGTVDPGEVLVYGHPATVEGRTSLGADGVSPSLEAWHVPAHQFVELRVLLPRRVLAGTDGARVVTGAGKETIVGAEAALAAGARRAAVAARGLSLAVLGLLALLVVALTWGYVRFGKEPRVAYDREYEQEPPSEHHAALVEALLAQGNPDERGFTALLFDFIRRGYLTGTPKRFRRAVLLGLRHTEFEDIEIALAEPPGRLTAEERAVYTILRRTLAAGPLPLHDFRGAIQENAQANHDTYQRYRALTRRHLVRAGLLDEHGRAFPWFVAGPLLLTVLLGVFLVVPLLSALTGLDPALGRFDFLALGAVGGILVALLGVRRRPWVRRTPDGAFLAARREAFRRHTRCLLYKTHAAHEEGCGYLGWSPLMKYTSATAYYHTNVAHADRPYIPHLIHTRLTSLL